MSEVAEKLPVTPAGAPSSVRSTLVVSPPPRTIVTVTVPLAPCCTLSVGAERVMPSVGVCVVPPPVPPGGVVVGASPPPPQAATATMKAIINFRIIVLDLIWGGVSQ